MSSRLSPKIEQLGPYELVRRLATGGMAEVYEARRVGPHGFSKRFALKRILPQLAGDARLVQMFCNEARLHAALSHPNLVEVVDFGEDQGALFIVMELASGLSCADLLSAIAARRRTVELGPALFIAREILAGLSYAHEFCDEAGRLLSLVHRDVAPNNILIARSGRVLLADFGIVRSAEFDLRTAAGEIKGKVGYISAEQALGAPVDARSDLFSVAVVLAELLLGEPLFPGRTELEILSSLHAGDVRTLERATHVPDALKALLCGALARDPSQRPASAREFLTQLEVIGREHDALIGADEFTLWLADLGLVSLKSGVESKRGSDVQAWSSEAPTVSVGPEPIALRVASPPPAAPPNASPSPTDAGPWYRIRRPGGTIVGPLTLARLLEMIATARAGADTEVSRSGAPFLPLSAVHELGRLAARAPYRFFDPIALFASERHAVDRNSLAWHLFRYVATRKTGLVCVRSGRDQQRMYLVSGVPAGSSSTEPDDLLGATLVRSGLVTQTALDATLEAGHRAGTPLGEALIGANLLSQEQLLRYLGEQRARRLAALLAFREGDLCFVDGAKSGDEALALPSSATAFVADAVRSSYPVEELRALLAGFDPAQYFGGNGAPALECRPILHLQRSLLGLT
ncbi:MAG TPA: protein kinase, partial [Polyangiaceae bacterium]|nr:protein kinase [Polyangiaceae bacterium]